MDNTVEWRPGPPLPTVCRCCLAEGCYKDISTEYFWNGRTEVYSEMLSSTFDIKISYSQSGVPNSNSRLICEACIARLRDATEFKKQVVECEKTFMQHLDPGRSAVEVEIAPELDEKEVKLEQVKEERALEDFNDIADFPDADIDLDDDDDLDDQPLTKLASKLPKKETVDILDLIDNKAATKRKATIKLKATSSKKVKTKDKEKSKHLKASASKDVIKPQKKKKGSVESDPPVLKWQPKRKYDDHRHNAAIIVECSNVCPFRWRPGVFTCAFCPLTFGEFHELKAHIIDHPNRIEVARHARRTELIKVEVSDLRCELCLESMPNIEELTEHLIKNHCEPINKKYGVGVAPYLIRGKHFFCTFCNASFEVFSKLNTHINEHYPNNICSECGKSFSAISRFRAHMLTHATGTFTCEKCNLEFPTRILKNNHVALVHKPAYKYRCPSCRESFKSFADRSKHLNEFHNRNIEYTCHLCSAVFLLCHQRTRHIRQVHTKPKDFSCGVCSYQFVTAAQLRNHMVKHTTEKPFQCEFCKKSYARRKTLREHLRIHLNDKRFTCEYCSTAFVQKCSLKSHIKTHHSNVVNIL